MDCRACSAPLESLTRNLCCRQIKFQEGVHGVKDSIPPLHGGSQIFFLLGMKSLYYYLRKCSPAARESLLRGDAVAQSAARPFNEDIPPIQHTQVGCGCAALWLLSLAILPAGLAVAAEATNLLRNPGFENGSEGWTLPNTFRVVDDVAHTGTRSLSWAACRARRAPAKSFRSAARR